MIFSGIVSSQPPVPEISDKTMEYAHVAMHKVTVMCHLTGEVCTAIFNHEILSIKYLDLTPVLSIGL